MNNNTHNAHTKNQDDKQASQKGTNGDHGKQQPSDKPTSSHSK